MIITSFGRAAARVSVLFACGLVPWTACGGGAAYDSEAPPPVAAEHAPAGTEPSATDLLALDTWSAELETRDGGRSLVPVGYGTLSQDDITVPLRSGELQIKWVPLSEWVLRLTAPDTYDRLNGYKVSRSEEILDRTARSGRRDWPLVAFVTFFSREVEESYEPNDLQIDNQGRLYRPFEIIPVTPGFGRNRLDQQETQIGLYLFDAAIDLDLPVVLRYGDARSDRWNSIRSTLDSEHQRAGSRAGVGRP